MKTKIIMLSSALILCIGLLAKGPSQGDYYAAQDACSNKDLGTACSYVVGDKTYSGHCTKTSGPQQHGATLCSQD